MPRPIKCRKVCHVPGTQAFAPVQEEGEKAPVILTVDEYEAIRLMDREGLSQEQCSEFMQIARTTVQRIYESARRKLAEMLVEGRPLRIEGGDFCLCDGENARCSRGQCYKRLLRQPWGSGKGEMDMRIAVTYEDGMIFQHFGHTAQFKLYDVADGKILSSQVVDTQGSGHGALAGVLQALRVDALICGGIGGGAQAALAEAGIQLYGGVVGNADQAAQALAEGTLVYQAQVKCNHHGHHHEEGHACGDHGCADHHCGHP